MQESSLNETKIQEFNENEIFSNVKVPPKLPLFIRLDGWKFRELTEKPEIKKPFDKKIAQCLVLSAKNIMKTFAPTLSYIISDEINILFTKQIPFNGRIEKINSIISGAISSSFSFNLNKILGIKHLVAFDSRVITISENDILSYLAWRQQNGWRNHNNAYAYWMLRKMGNKPSEAAKKLKGLKTKQIHDMLMERGVNLAETPQWERRGILVYKEPYEKTIKGKVKVTRRKIVENWKLPIFTTSEGKNLIQEILEST